MLGESLNLNSERDRNSTHASHTRSCNRKVSDDGRIPKHKLRERERDTESFDTAISLNHPGRIPSASIITPDCTVLFAFQNSS